MPCGWTTRKRDGVSVGSTLGWGRWPGFCLRPSAARGEVHTSLDLSFLMRKWGVQLNFRRTFSLWDARADGLLKEGPRFCSRNCVIWRVSQTGGIGRIMSFQSTPGRRWLGNTLSWLLECLFHSEDRFLKGDRVTHQTAVTWWNRMIQFPFLGFQAIKWS